MTIHLEDHTSEATAAFKQAVARALEMCCIGTNMAYTPYVKPGTGVYRPGGRTTI